MVVPGKAVKMAADVIHMFSFKKAGSIFMQGSDVANNFTEDIGIL